MLPRACLPGRREAAAIGLRLLVRYGHIGKIQTKGRQKYSARLVTLTHNESLTNRFLHITSVLLQMRIVVSHKIIVQRARELSAHTRTCTILRSKDLRSLYCSYFNNTPLVAAGAAAADVASAAAAASSLVEACEIKKKTKYRLDM